MKKLTNLLKKVTKKNVEVMDFYDAQVVTAENTMIKISIQAKDYDDAEVKLRNFIHESCTLFSIEKRTEG